MTLNRREILQATLAAGSSLVLPDAARAQSMAGITPGKPYAGQEVKVLAVRSSQFTSHAKRAKAFEDATGIKVTYVDVPFGSMREKLTAEMVSASADFDLATIMDVWIPPMVDNYLLPLNAHLKAQKFNLDRYPGAFLAASQFKGDTYGLPNRCHIQLLFYRKDVFDELGIKPPKTWAELVAAGKTIQAKKPDLAGVAIPYGKSNGQNLMVWYNFLWGNGSDLFDAKMKPIFNNAKGLQATQDYVDIILKHKITPPGCASFIEQDAAGSFVQGKSAMLPIWWHIYNRFGGKDSVLSKEQVGFVPLPTYAGAQPSTYVNDWIYGVNRHSKVAKATLEFLLWISQPEVERAILVDPTENDVVAVNWSNLRDPEVNRRFGNMHNVAAQALTKTKSIPNIPEFLPVVDVMEVAMSNIVTGQASVADAMNSAASQVTRIMRRAG